MASVLTASEADLPNWKLDNMSLSDVTEEDGASQEGYGLDEEVERNSGALVVHTANALMASGDLEQPQDQLEVLLEELGRIETQQDKLRDAVKHNKQIVVHPRQEVLDETDSEYDSPKAATPKKRILVSGGLTGFGVAQDLLQLDFSPPEEAPEEFRAVPFFEAPRQIRPGLSGSFGLCDPASKEMHHYLERLEEQQKLVLELISGKKQQLLDTMGKTGRASTKQMGKSRLAKSSRLGDGGEKAAVASALGLAGDKAAGDKVGALGGKMASLSVGKGALAAKLPLSALSAGRSGPAARSGPSRHQTQQAAAAAAARRAQVQKEDADAKEEEEMRALFAKPMLGTTPSTMHLAGKKNRAAAAEAAPAPVSPASPQRQPVKAATPRGSPVAVQASAIPEEGPEQEAWEGTAAATIAAPKSGMFKGLNKGLKKMLRGKQKA